MKSKILISIITVGIIYLIFSFMGSSRINNASDVKKEIINHAAKWFETKGVNKIVSTEFFPFKQEEVFNSYEIEIHKDHSTNTAKIELPNNDFDQEFSTNENLINLEHSFKLARKSHSKGIYIQGDFAANDKSVELMQTFIEENGFIYFNSIGNFHNLSSSFISFINKSISSNSITILDFKKMNHQSGSTLESNLPYLFHYDNSNVAILINKLNKRLENDEKLKNELNSSSYQY